MEHSCLTLPLSNRRALFSSSRKTLTAEILTASLLLLTLRVGNFTLAATFDQNLNLNSKPNSISGVHSNPSVMPTTTTTTTTTTKTTTTITTNSSSLSSQLKKLTIGYLPIDKTFHGYQLVERQYRVISGALTYAIDVINKKRLIPGYEVGFVWNDTHGTISGGLQAITDQWRMGVDMFLGPEETCNYEGRVAAAWNLPMLSFVSLEDVGSLCLSVCLSVYLVLSSLSFSVCLSISVSLLSLSRSVSVCLSLSVSLSLSLSVSLSVCLSVSVSVSLSVSLCL